MGIVFLLLFGMAACSNELAQSPVATDSATGVKVSIPLFSPFFNEVLGDTIASRGPSTNRMYIGVSSVRVTLFDQVNTQVLVENLDITIASANAVSSDGKPIYSTSDICTLNALPGDYTVRVEVFNAKNSLLVPVVQGEKAITITDGTIESALVTCFPVNPEPLAYEHVVVDLEPTVWEQSINQIDVGQEKWFSFTATAIYQCFRIIPEDPGITGHIITVYDSHNNLVDSYSPMNTDNQSEYFMVNTTPGDTYYVGCITVDRSYDFLHEEHAGSFSIALHQPLLSEIISATTDTMIFGGPADGVSLVAKEGLTSADISIIYVEAGCVATLDGVPVNGTTASINLANEVSILDIDCEINGVTHTERWYIKTEIAKALAHSEEYEEIHLDENRHERTWLYLQTNPGVEYQVFENSTTYNVQTRFYDSTGEYLPSTTRWFGDYRIYTYTADVEPLFISSNLRWYETEVYSLFRIRESLKNSSPMIDDAYSIVSLSVMQSRESDIETVQFEVYDPDGDTLSVSASCTQTPPNVSSDQVSFSARVSGSYLNLEMDRFAPAGDYSFLVELDDSQGFDGTDGTNEASVIQIPVNVTVQDISCLARMDVSAFSIATGSTVSIEVTLTADPDLDPDSIELTLPGIPGGSTAVLSEPVASVMLGNITATAEFTPDIIGTYFVQFQYTCNGETRTILKQISAYDDTQGGINVTID